MTNTIILKFKYIYIKVNVFLTPLFWKRLAHFDDLDQMQKQLFPTLLKSVATGKKLLLLTIFFARSSKKLLLFWTCSLQTKPHYEKKQMLDEDKQVLLYWIFFARSRHSQWSFALDCPLCKRSVQPMIQIEGDWEQHDLQDATPWTTSSCLTQTSEYCCIESFSFHGTGWSRWSTSFAKIKFSWLSSLPGADLSRWSRWFAK